MVRGPVSFNPQQQVVAKAGPGMMLVALVEHIPVRGVTLLAVGVFHSTAQVVDEDILGLCRTILIQEIIPVYSCCCGIVFSKSLHDMLLFLAGQVEHLLNHRPVQVLIFCLEILERYDAHFIIRETKDEFGDEKRLFERKHPIVHHDVAAPGGIRHPDGRMAIIAVDFLSRIAGEQTDFQRIIGTFGHDILCHCHLRQQQKNTNGYCFYDLIDEFHAAKVTDIFHLTHDLHVFLCYKVHFHGSGYP